MLASFPLLLAESTADGAAWHGYLQCGPRAFRIRLEARRQAGPPADAAPAELPAPGEPAGTAGAAAGSTSKPWLQLCSVPSNGRGSASMRSSISHHLHIDCEDDLVLLLHGSEPILKQFWQQSQSDLHSFLIELQDFITRRVRSAAAPVPLSAVFSSQHPPALFYSSLLAELASLPGGWSNVRGLDERTCHDLTLVTVDAARREHFMRLTLPENYPQAWPTAQVDLPVQLDSQLLVASGSGAAAVAATSSREGALSFPAAAAPSWPPISALYARFQTLVHNCQPFWNQLDELGRHAWILEPEAPIPRAAQHRRIAVGPSIWLELTLDPLRPFAAAALRIVGSDEAAAPLRGRLESALAAGEWDSAPGDAGALLRNLLRVLGRSELPAATEMNRDEFNLECRITAPDWVCPSPRCKSVYHLGCLTDWLRAVSTKQVFRSLYGECPNCNEKITVAMPANA